MGSNYVRRFLAWPPMAKPLPPPPSIKRSHTDFYDTPISKDEYEEMVKVMAHRVANLACAKSYGWTRHVLEQLNFLPGMKFVERDGHNSIKVEFTINFIQNDLVEIVTGLRREKE